MVKDDYHNPPPPHFYPFYPPEDFLAKLPVIIFHNLFHVWPFPHYSYDFPDFFFKISRKIRHDLNSMKFTLVSSFFFICCRNYTTLMVFVFGIFFTFSKGLIGCFLVDLYIKKMTMRVL